MSKIMRQLYAEARAAREAHEAAMSARATPQPVLPTPGRSPAATAPAAVHPSIDWWAARYRQAGRALRDPAS